MADFTFENAAGARNGVIIAGVDEVGRGALAGPVVAAAVVFFRRRLAALRPLVRDSKTLTVLQRRRLAGALPAFAHIATGIATVEEIEELNVLGASLLAMRRAVDRLPERPALALIDGDQVPALDHVDCRCIPHGDNHSLSIAAASIIAKVARDALMCEFDARHPGYGWTHNSGYATREHLEALRRLGPTPLHRHHFRGVCPDAIARAADLAD